MANIARTPAEVIAGEAVHGTLQERFTDMVHIASVMANRARLTGRSLKDVVSATSKRGVKQFSTYGRSLPDGTKNLVSLAERAIAMVEQNGPITPATYYATPAARTSLPPGLTDVGQTTGHVYAVDPENRAIGVGSGFVRPSVGLRNPTNPMGGVSVAASRQSLPPDRNMPSGAVSSTLGRGLAALAPNGLRDLPDRAQPAVSFDMGPNRPNAPNRSITNLARDAVNDTVGMGPGYKMSVISGQENPGNQYGSNRHKTGLAADINVIDPTGRRLNVVQDRQKMMDLAQTLAAKGATGIGIGSNYMGATGIHADLTQPGPGQANTWGNLGAKYRNELTNAMKFAEMPASYYDAKMPAKTSILGFSRPANPAYEAQQRQQMASTMQEAGIRGLGATSQLSAPIGNVARQNLSAPTQYAGRPASVARSAAGPALAAALERAGISRPSPLSSQDAAARMGVTRPSTLLSDQNAAARMGPQPAGAIYSPSPTGARVGTGPISAPRAPTQYEGRPSSVARSVAGPNLSRALAERGLTGSTGAAPSSMAPDRPMPSGAISRPNLAAALEKRGIASPTQYAGRPASVASRVASATSAGSTVGIPGQTAPESPTLGPAPTAPGDVTQTTIGPAGIRPGLIATGPIQTRPKVSIPAPTRVAPVRTQPRVVQPVQQPPQPIQPVQAPAPLGQQAFAARANPVDPGLRAADVYGGAIGTAQTSTPGTTVSRQNSWGPTTVTNKFGAQTAMVGDRQAAVGKPFGGLGGNLSPNAKSVLGGLAGGILGAMAAGPTGALAGGMLGRKMASGGLGGSSAPGGGGGQAGGGLLGGMFGGGTVGNARGGNNERSGGTGGGTIGGGGGRGRRGGQGN